MSAILLPLSGSNNGTVFKDLSPNNRTISRFGDTKTVTDQSKYYGSSAFFDGTGDYLTANMGSFSMTGDFTMEMWLRPASFGGGPGGANRCPLSFGVGDGQGALLLDAAGPVLFYAGSTRLTTSTALVLDEWQHLAFSRSGNTLRAFINGVPAGSATFSSAVGGNPLFIGRSVENFGDYSGYLQDVHITDGTGLYTAAFTPPEQLANLLSGTVRDKNGDLAVGRTVQAIRESNRACVATGTTDANGAFVVAVLANEAHTLIFDGEPDRNSLIYRGVIPE